MSPFVAYLLAVNVVAFLAYTLDFFLCKALPNLDATKANSMLMCLFPVAGGPVGTLLALLVWTGSLGRKRRMNKGNVAWWFTAIVCLIVWGVVCAAVLGFADLGLDALLAAWNLTVLKWLGVYLLLINVVTFAVFAVDKPSQKAAEKGAAFPRRACWG